MALNIHFFRKSNLEKVDYSKILDYFESLPHFKIFYTDDYVELAYSDAEFAFNYRYLITKQSRVAKIYELNPMYSNINFMLEMPVMIPIFLAKEILAIVQKLCKTFELDIYHESFSDVEPFNLVDMLVLFEKIRSARIEEFGLKDKMLLDNEKLNVICKYQRSIDSLKEYYHQSVDVNYCVPIVNEINGNMGISYTWQLGHPAIFPPYIDYVFIEMDDENPILLKRVDLYHILNKYFTEIKTFLPDLFVIKEKQAPHTRKEYKKMKRVAIDDSAYKLLRLCDVIETQKEKKD